MRNMNEVSNLLSDLLDELSKLSAMVDRAKKQIQNVLEENNVSMQRTNLYLYVRMPNGKIICHSRCSDTFVETIELLGTEKAHRAAVARNIRWRNYPVVDIGHHDESHWRESGKYGIYVGGNTPNKAKNLRKIADYLGLSMKVCVLNETDYQVFLET